MQKCYSLTYLLSCPVTSMQDFVFEKEFISNTLRHFDLGLISWILCRTSRHIFDMIGPQVLLLNLLQRINKIILNVPDYLKH